MRPSPPWYLTNLGLGTVGLLWIQGRESMATVGALLRLDLNLLILGDHLVLEGPAETATQLRDNNVTVTEEVDIEVDVTHSLARDINLGDV